MITTLILDADGVLINGERFADVRARELQVNPEKEREFFTTIFQQCLVGKADLKEAIAPYLPAFGWKGTVDEFLDYWFKAEHSLNKDLMQQVQKLRNAGIIVALATNQEKYRTQYMLDHMGFKDAFDKIYSSAHLGLKKPAIEFFAKVIGDLGVEKEEVLFWDDDQQNIDGAKEYGIHAEFYSDYDSFLAVMEENYGITVLSEK
jgi:putative hydrolase of the HAD superfamily